MAQPFQEKKTVEKVIRDTFNKNFLQPIIDIIGSCEIDAIICLSPLSSNNENQFVIKVHERLKNDRVDRSGVRNNGEPSILKKYLAGGTSTLTPEPNHLQVDALSRKRKAWDENDNAIYSSGKKLINLNQVQYPVLKTEAIDEQDGGDNPLNLSDRCGVITETQLEKEGKLYTIGTISGRELNSQCFCGICLLICSSYKALQDHFVEVHSSNLRFFCSECSTGFADSVAHTKHIAQHSGPNQSASNRRKQSKPRKGIIAHSDLSDDDIPQNKVQLANENHPSSVTSRTDGRPFLATAVINRTEGIVKTLLQKQALPIGILSEAGMLLKRSSHSASPLSLVIQDTADDSNTECCKCPHCEALFDTFALYDEHCRMDHKRFACSFCLKTFTQRVNRDRHIHSHTGIRPFTCEHCGSDFKRQDALKKHREKANHQPIATVSTPSLQIQSSLNCQLDQETSENSANEDVAHDTPLLLDSIDNSETNDIVIGSLSSNEGRSKMTSGDMHLQQSTDDASGSKVNKRHVATDVKRSGQGDGPPEDDESSDELSVHSYHSTDNGNPQLSDAGNTQSSDAGNRPGSAGPLLDDHLRPFNCDFCSESVVGTAAYKEHCKVKHHRTPCISCGKTFSQKGNMERHMRQHTGERPFRCQFCQCAYTRKETLKTHINQAHSCKAKLEFDNL